ncbi:MAG: extensin family protein [Beijerinckiaceae bacterium]
MRPLHLAALLLGLAAVSIGGCSRYQKEQRAEWRSAAEKSCLRSGVVKESAHVKIARALEGAGPCGADHPIKVSAFAMDNLDLTASAPGLFTPRGGFLTKLNNEGTLTCPMYAAMDKWLEEVVQPAAMARFGQAVIELRTMGTYSCRSMNNQRGARLSEHSFANAIDVGGFRLQDGSVVTILKGWKGSEPEQYFLRDVHAGACKHFATVLGPGADAYHYDHLHMDLARHGRRGDRSICRPFPQATPPSDGMPMSDPARGNPMAQGPAASPRGDAYAFATPPGVTKPTPPALLGSGPVLPGYRPTQLPAAPRNPLAAADMAEPSPKPLVRRPAQPIGAPTQLYGKGQGPFQPLREDEIDPEDLDPITGSVGE